MSKRLILLVAVGGIVIAAAFAGAGAARADTFVGAWVGVESPVGDGSTDYMVIGAAGPSGVRAYAAWEDWATFCGGGPLSSWGTAVSDGGNLRITITGFECENGSSGATPPPIVLDGFATGDGRIDIGGVIFSRIRRAQTVGLRARVPGLVRDRRAQLDDVRVVVAKHDGL